MVKRCAICEKEFEALGRGKYCSKECKGSFRRKRYFEDRENQIKRVQNYRKENIEERKDYDKKYRERTKVRRKTQRVDYYLKNKESIRERKRNIYSENREREIKRVVRYISKRRKEDKLFLLRHNIASLMRKCLREKKGGESILKYLPYTIQQLCEHLESQFESWMTWENHGIYKIGGEKTWQIDHIIPQSSLPYDSMEHPNFEKCWMLSNLRPLESLENNRKGNKIIGDINV